MIPRLGEGGAVAPKVQPGRFVQSGEATLLISAKPSAFNSVRFAIFCLNEPPPSAPSAQTSPPSPRRGLCLTQNSELETHNARAARPHPQARGYQGRSPCLVRPRSKRTWQNVRLGNLINSRFSSEILTCHYRQTVPKPQIAPMLKSDQQHENT